MTYRKDPDPIEEPATFDDQYVSRYLKHINGSPECKERYARWIHLMKYLYKHDEAIKERKELIAALLNMCTNMKSKFSQEKDIVTMCDQMIDRFTDDTSANGPSPKRQRCAVHE